MVHIVDASVAIKWFVQEEKRDIALSVLQRIINKPKHFAVPELFYFELAHAFNRLIKKPSPLQLHLLGQVTIFGIYRFSMTPELLSEIIYFQSLGLSGYDSAYIGLAKILKGKWITFDKKAHSTIEHLNLSECLI